jgi:hypothetical protein
VKPYTLIRRLGEPAVNKLEFQTADYIRGSISPCKLGNLTAAGVRELAVKIEQDAQWHRQVADELKADVAQLRDLVCAMDPDAGKEVARL